MFLLLVFLHQWSVNIVTRWLGRRSLFLLRASVQVLAILAGKALRAINKILVFHRLKIVLGLVEWVSSVATSWSLFHELLFLGGGWHAGAWVCKVSISWEMLLIETIIRFVAKTTALTYTFLEILLLRSQTLVCWLICNSVLTQWFIRL